MRKSKRRKSKNFSIKNYIKQKEIESRKRIRHKKRYDLETRLGWLMKTGKIIDFTAMEEIDSWFLPLWKQYEYLRFIEIYYKKKLLKAIEEGTLKDNELTEERLKEIIEILEQNRKLQKEILKYMFNAISIIYGSVLKNKFRKWKSLRNVLTTKFIEITTDNIQKLKYNPDVSRPVIYFYQSCWLGGLSLIKKIQEERKRRKIRIEDKYEEFKYNDRGNKLVSDYKEFIEEFNLESNFINSDNDKNLQDEEKTLDYITEQEAEIIDSSSSTSINTLNSDVSIDDVKDYAINEHNEFEDEFYTKEEIEEIRRKVIEIVRKLLNELNISIDMFYNLLKPEKSNNTNIDKKLTQFKKLFKEKFGNNLEDYLTKEEMNTIKTYLNLVRKGLI